MVISVSSLLAFTLCVLVVFLIALPAGVVHVPVGVQGIPLS